MRTKQGYSLKKSSQPVIEISLLKKLETDKRQKWLKQTLQLWTKLISLPPDLLVSDSPHALPLTSTNSIIGWNWLDKIKMCLHKTAPHNIFMPFDR